MAGHSKWANIKHRKAILDIKRGKMWTRLLREVKIASTFSSGEISSNPRLRLAIEKANDANIPKENINRAIQCNMHAIKEKKREDIRYEGYSADGVAIIIDTMTDNHVRTAAEIRNVFSKFGGKLGYSGSVSFMFERVGYFLFMPITSVDRLLEISLEIGANSIINKDGNIEIICSSHLFVQLRDSLQYAGFMEKNSGFRMKPKSVVPVDHDAADRTKKLISAFEHLDDVQEVFNNAVFLETGCSDRSRFS